MQEPLEFDPVQYVKPKATQGPRALLSLRTLFSPEAYNRL